MSETLYAVFKDGKMIGEVGYGTLLGACDALKDAPAGSVVGVMGPSGDMVRQVPDSECRKVLLQMNSK